MFVVVEFVAVGCVRAAGSPVEASPFRRFSRLFTFKVIRVAVFASDRFA